MLTYYLNDYANMFKVKQAVLGTTGLVKVMEKEIYTEQQSP